MSNFDDKELTEAEIFQHNVKVKKVLNNLNISLCHLTRLDPQIGYSWDDRLLSSVLIGLKSVLSEAKPKTKFNHHALRALADEIVNKILRVDIKF